VTSEYQLLAILIILLAFVINATQVFLRRGGAVPVRPISAFKKLMVLGQASIEGNNPVHISLGSSSVGKDTTLLSLASAELAYHTTLQLTDGDVSPIFTLTETTTLPLAMNTLRRAYTNRQRMEIYKPFNVRWLPAGERSLAFASAVTALQREEPVSANVFAGRFGIEMSLLLHAAQRQSPDIVATSDQLIGQAIAYGVTDNALIGEEVFAANAYLDPNPAERDRIIAIDFLRWTTIIAIFALAIIFTLNGS